MNKKIKKKFSALDDSTKKAVIIGIGVFCIALIIIASNFSKSSDNLKILKET